MTTNRDLARRLAAIEEAINAGAVELAFVWTRNLAAELSRP